MQSYYFEDISISHIADPRHFLKPTEKELNDLKPGDIVRLFFVFNFETEDGCRAERMWVEILEINADSYKGYLTNQSLYIQNLQPGTIVTFHRNNIATLIIPPLFDEEKKAIITLKALKKNEINWAICGDLHNNEDSGWQLFYGDEDEAYLDDTNNATIITLEEALAFEPRLEQVFSSSHNAFEWNKEFGNFVAVHE